MRIARETLSVLMPTYNGASTVSSSLASILDQAVDVEVIVQDGASTDTTVSLIQSLEGNGNISIRSEPDSGQSQALNRALERSSGTIIGWLNSDDFYSPGALEAVMAAVAAHPEADVYYGDFALARSDGTQLRRYHVSQWNRDRFFRNGAYVWCETMFVRRSVYERFGGYDESLHYCMDLDFLLRIGAHVNTHYIPQVLGTFVMAEGSKTSTARFSFVREAHRVTRRHAALSPKLHAYATYNSFRKIAYMATRRIWLSSTWSRFRKEKAL